MNIVIIIFKIILGFAILLSIVGLFGVIFRNRCLLILYEIIVLILFLIHLAALIILLVFYPRVEQVLKDELDRQVNSINSYSNANSFITDCGIMKNISTLFQCCGSSSPNDIKVEQNRRLCCSDAYNFGDNGCTPTINNLIKKYSNYYIIIPTAIILFIEFCALILVPIMVCQITSDRRYKY